MVSISPESANQVRRALAIIVADPGHGAAALDDPQILANLLTDLLPDTPRDKNLLVAAAEARLAKTIFDHVMQGLDTGSAVRLAAAGFGTRTHFPAEACTWAATEFAVALNLMGGLDSAPTAPAPEARPDGNALPKVAAPKPLPEQTAPGSIAPLRQPRAAGPTPPPTIAPKPPRGHAAAQPTRWYKVGSALVLLGTVALVVAFFLPVTFNPGSARILTFPLFIAGLPTMALVIAALSAAPLWLGRAPLFWQATAGAASVLAGLEFLIFYLAVWLGDVRTGAGLVYGGLPAAVNADIGLVIGPLCALPLIAGGIALLRSRRPVRGR